jgi:hypothetical protein
LLLGSCRLQWELLRASFCLLEDHVRQLVAGGDRVKNVQVGLIGSLSVDLPSLSSVLIPIYE